MATAAIQLLEEHITKRLGNETSQLGDVLHQFRYMAVKRKELLLREGEVCKHVYFVAKGCLQVYVHDKDMNETTRDLVTEDNWCTELISFGCGRQSTENIKAVEPCELLAIHADNFRKMMEAVPQFDKVYKQILETSYANSVYRINAFVSLSALDRIKWLMDYRPTLLSRLPSKLVASYLGISQETFSRLKVSI